jgi:MipA family protein
MKLVSALTSTPFRSNKKLATVGLLVSIACLTAVSNSAVAQMNSPASNKKDDSPWRLSLGLFVSSSSDYEGGKKRVTSALPDFNLSYRTKDFGTFGVGSKSRGASWTIIDKEEYSFGIALGGDAGRTDKKDGSAFRPGSKRLLGLGEIKSSAEFGVFGHIVAGVPISLQIMKGIGDGKTDSKDFSIKGHGGTRAELGVEIPLPLTESLTLSLSPSVSWADKKYTQTYFGVTSAQAARSNFKQYNAKGGVKSVNFGVGLNYQIDKNWSANAGLTYSQLQGDAAKSPIIEKKGQPSALIGIGYTF